jgi:hypothetical protein
VRELVCTVMACHIVESRTCLVLVGILIIPPESPLCGQWFRNIVKIGRFPKHATKCMGMNEMDTLKLDEVEI